MLIYNNQIPATGVSDQVTDSKDNNRLPAQASPKPITASKSMRGICNNRIPASTDFGTKLGL